MPCHNLLQVISRGGVNLHNKLDTLAASGQAVNEASIALPITASMVPGARVLVGFARTDGELVMDLLEVKVDCQLENKVCVYMCVAIDNSIICDVTIYMPNYVDRSAPVCPTICIIIIMHITPIYYFFRFHCRLTFLTLLNQVMVLPW